jgi:hypothetical protein
MALALFCLALLPTTQSATAITLELVRAKYLAKWAEREENGALNETRRRPGADAGPPIKQTQAGVHTLGARRGFAA